MEYFSVEQLEKLKGCGFKFPATSFCMVADNGGNFVKLLPYSTDIEYLSYVRVYPVITLHEALKHLPNKICEYKLEINFADKLISYISGKECLISFGYADNIMEAVFRIMSWVYTRKVDVKGGCLC